MVILSECLKIAQKRGVTSVIGYYSATKKNEQTKSFFDDRGFRMIGASENQEIFAIALEKINPFNADMYECFKEVTSKIPDTLEEGL